MVQTVGRENDPAGIRFASELTEPMLARTDALPPGDYDHEVKWDRVPRDPGDEDGLQVGSRRDWSVEGADAMCLTYARAACAA
jgi:hypothetical protein